MTSNDFLPVSLFILELLRAADVEGDVPPLQVHLIISLDAPEVHHVSEVPARQHTDASHGLDLFQEPVEVAMRPRWIDYRTLQPLPTELIDEQLRRRYPDMTWRVRTTDGTTDLILLLEFQGRPERHMALRTTAYSCLATQSLIQHDKELGHGDRELAVVALVLHHGDRSWNAATRLSDLFRDSAPDAYRVVGRMPGDAQPTDPQDLPQVVLGLSGVRTAAQMRAALTVLRQLVEACEDGDFDRFMARSVKAMLRSKGFSNRQLAEAMTMSTVVTEFQRSLEEIKQEGIEQGQVAVLVQQIARKFGEGTADEVQRLLVGGPGRERIAWVAAAILDCDTPEDFLARVRED